MKNIERTKIEIKLKEALNHKLNILVAPKGYGKTTLLNKLTHDQNVFKLNISSDYNTSIKLCRKICLDIFGVDNYNQMRLINKKIDNENFLIALLCVEAVRRTNLVLIIDDFELIESTEVNNLLLRIAKKIPDSLKISFIISTSRIPHNSLFNYFDDKPESLIGYEDLCFSKDEVSDLMASNELAADGALIDKIFDKTIGWPMGVNYSIRYFFGDYKAKDELYDFIENNILSSYSTQMQQFIQCAASIERIPSGIFDYIAEPSKFRKEFGLISKNNNYIYKDDTGFILHPILREFLLNSSKPKNNEYANSILNYFKAKKEYDQLFYIFDSLDMQDETKDMAIYLANTRFVERNRVKYFNLLNTLSKEVILDNEILSLNYARYAGDNLSLSEKTKYFNNALKIYENSDSYSDSQKESIKNEITIFKALSNTENISEMLKQLKTVEACDFNYKLNFSPEYFRLNSSRALFVYYQKGKYGQLLADVSEVERILSAYGFGNCNGLTNLCRGEMQYLKGNISQAETIINTALEEAKSGNQFSIIVACYYLHVKIYKYQNNKYLVERTLNSINSMIKRKVDDQKYIYDVAKLWYYLKENNLTNDALFSYYIEYDVPKYNNITAEICNIEYYILRNDLDEAVIRINSLIDECSKNCKDLTLIALYILLAEVHFKNKSYTDSLKALKKAKSIADLDEIIMPFVERGDIMIDMLNKFEKSIPITFRLNVINKIKELSSNFQNKNNDNKYKLSKREIDVIELMKLGFKNTEIAVELGIKPDTVKEYIHNIFVKMGVSNRLEAVMKYKE